MREIPVETIVEAVSGICREAAFDIGEDMFEALEHAYATEVSPLGKHALQILLENARMAKDERLPYCQDCGVAVFFVEVGQEVHILGGALTDAINEGVRQAYKDAYLRNSMLRSPLDRVNTGDNTPALIHYDIAPGDRLKLHVTEKGGGCENMSRQKMITPSEGVEGVKRFVVETVENAGPNACPPLIPGVGVGGNFDMSCTLAKKALLRRIGDWNPDPNLAKLEKELLVLCNETGVGPQGLGGLNTVLWVPVEALPCHITALPVGVNIQCHAQRHREVIL